MAALYPWESSFGSDSPGIRRMYAAPGNTPFFTRLRKTKCNELEANRGLHVNNQDYQGSAALTSRRMGSNKSSALYWNLPARG